MNVETQDTFKCPLCHSPAEVRARFAGFKFANLTIKSLRMLGCAYLSNTGYPEVVDDIMEKTDDDDLILRWTLAKCGPEPGTKGALRFLQLDTPFIIEFEDGTTFEVFAQGDSSYDLARDRIGIAGVDVEEDAGHGVEANMFFENCVGRTVVDLEFKTSKAKPEFYVADPGGETRDEYIESFALRLDSGVRIWFGNWIDYFTVHTTEPDGKDSIISAPDLVRSIIKAPGRHELVAACLARKLQDGIKRMEADARKEAEDEVKAATVRAKVKELLGKLEALRDSKQPDAIAADWFNPLVNALYAVYRPCYEPARQFKLKFREIKNNEDRLTLAIALLRAKLTVSGGGFEGNLLNVASNDDYYMLVYSPAERKFFITSGGEYDVNAYVSFRNPGYVKRPYWLFGIYKEERFADAALEVWNNKLLQQRLEEKERASRPSRRQEPRRPSVSSQWTLWK